MARYNEAHKEHINKYKMAHCIGVAEYMRERANDYGVDPDTAYTIGLLHDIGYLNGRADHEVSGAEILAGIGIKPEYKKAITLHGTDPYKQNYSDVDNPMYVLLLEADLSVDRAGYRIGFDKRLEDIISHNTGEFVKLAGDTAANSQKFVKQWQAEHNVSAPPKGFSTRDCHKREKEQSGER